MEELSKMGIVEQIYPGYEEERKIIAEKYEVNHKSDNLNFAKLKRESNLKTWIDSQPSEKIIFVDKRSVLFVDVEDRILYSFMSENNMKQIVRKFKKENKLTYLTAINLLLSPSSEEIHDSYGSLFDASIYEIEKYDSVFYEEANQKSKTILQKYGSIISNVRIITRDNSKGDMPKINMFELSSDCELAYKEDWSKYIPVDLLKIRENEEVFNKLDNQPKERKNKFVKLKKQKQKKVKMNRGSD